MIVYGINAVLEALRAGRVRRVIVARSGAGRGAPASDELGGVQGSPPSKQRSGAGRGAPVPRQARDALSSSKGASDELGGMRPRQSYGEPGRPASAEGFGGSPKPRQGGSSKNEGREAPPSNRRGRGDRRIDEVVALARQRRLAVEHVDVQSLDRAARGGAHQGIAADLEAPRDYSLAEMVGAAAPDPPLIVVLDGIEDPRNVGAILRTADAAGCHGVVRQARHAAALDGVAAKASAGAVVHVRVATVVNIARAVDELKELGVWTLGLDGTAAETYDAADLTLPTALVLGAEGTGLRRLVRERCDRIVAIPMLGSVGSLNVSVAAGVTLFEAVRQRKGLGRRPPRPSQTPNG